MTPVSVVIICKNEAHIIGRTLASVAALTDDVIVVDSGSTDGTQEIVRDNGSTLVETTWNGFGINKNKGIAAAKYDWILSIDADEMPDSQLIKSIAALDLSDSSVVYNLRFKTYLGKKLIKHGEWGNDSHIRLFSRQQVHWNNAEVHEQLLLPSPVTIKNIDGYILHYTMKDLAEYALKMTTYALLNAEEYFKKGKKASWISRNVSPRFSFFKNYIIKLGFMDGVEGYWIAQMTAHYTFLKYARLYELHQLNK